MRSARLRCLQLEPSHGRNEPSHVKGFQKGKKHILPDRTNHEIQWKSWAVCESWNPRFSIHQSKVFKLHDGPDVAQESCQDAIHRPTTCTLGTRKVSPKRIGTGSNWHRTSLHSFKDVLSQLLNENERWRVQVLIHENFQMDGKPGQTHNQFDIVWPFYLELSQIKSWEVDHLETHLKMSALFSYLKHQHLHASRKAADDAFTWGRWWYHLSWKKELHPFEHRTLMNNNILLYNSMRFRWRQSPRHISLVIPECPAHAVFKAEGIP